MRRFRLYALVLVISCTSFIFSSCLERKDRTKLPEKINITEREPDKKYNIPMEPEITDNTPPDLAGGPESSMRDPAHNPSVNNVFYSGSSKLKQAALTFDDGPDIVYTSQILDILKANNIKATFFIVGTRAQQYPEMIKRIAREGHAIGNHSWNHPRFSGLAPEKIMSEVTKTDNLIYSIAGYHTNLFRPPYGAATPEVIKQLGDMGYYVIDWSVDTRDWEGASPSGIMQFVKKEIRPGGIILQHCAGGKKENLNNTVSALRQIIIFLSSQGYTFVDVPQLLGIPVSH